MKKKSLLFLILSFLCVGLISGCGEETFQITTEVADKEGGYITGSGSYVKGNTVNLRVYVNSGCTLQDVEFTKKDSAVTTNVAMEESPDRKYMYYDFAVTDDTIGNYKANFDCSRGNTTNQGSINIKNKVKFYIIKTAESQMSDSDPFNLRSDASSSEVPYIELSTNTAITEVKKGSTVITKNIRNVPKYPNEKFTWYKCSSFTSYTKRESDLFDQSAKISTDLNLCGFGEVKDPVNEVKEGIELFASNSTGVVITSGEYSAHVKNLNVKANDTRNKTYIKVFKTAESTNIVGVYIDGYYYEYIKGETDTRVTALQVVKANGENYESVSGLKLENISTIYPYIKLKDIDITKVEKISSNSTGTVYKVNDGAYLITINDGGQIVEFVDKTDGETTYTISYPSSITNVSIAKYKDAYLIQVSSNRTSLNEELKKINNTYESSIKISQGYGETVEKQLSKNNTLQNLLKRYSYTWKLLADNETTCTSSSRSISQISEYIEGTVKLCAYVPEDSMSIDEINTTLNKIDSFDTKIKINYLGADHDVASYINTNFDYTGVDVITSNLFSVLRSISTKFSSFSYNESSKLYTIYVESTSLTIKFSDDKTKIENIDYRANDGTTYKYTFSNFTLKA